MMELCGAELCGLDWCRTRNPATQGCSDGHSESVQLLLTAKGNIHAEDMVNDSLPQI